MQKTKTIFAGSLLALLIALTGCGDKGDRALETEEENKEKFTVVNSGHH